MFTSELESFADELEAALSGVRAELLIAEHDSDAVLHPALHAEKVGRLLSFDDACLQAGVGRDLAMLQSLISTLPGQGVHPNDVRAALDRITEIESKVVSIRMRECDFDEDLDRLLDASFGFAAADQEIVFEPEPEADDAGFEADEELREVFSAEADELLDRIESGILDLGTGTNNEEALWNIRRAAHTLKGSAGIVGSHAMSRLAHRMEDLLDLIAEGREQYGPEVLQLLSAALTALRELVTPENENELPALLARVHSGFDKYGKPPAAPVPAEPPPDAHAATESAPQEHRAFVRVPLEQMDALTELVRELSTTRTAINERLTELDRLVEDVHNTARRVGSLNARFDADAFPRRSLRNRFDLVPARAYGAPGEHFDPLEMDRYDELHETAQELAEATSGLDAANHELGSLRWDLASLFAAQQRQVDDLGGRIRAARMIAFGSLQHRLERAVRVTCEDERKQAVVVIENGDCEVDTQVLSQLVEPLIHLLKNAVVHGIESAETRRLLGKGETGRITVSVAMDETHLEISVADDGGGISLVDLRDRAIVSGEVDRDTAAKLTPDEVLELMFRTGLTTARRVTLNAGRGVGMNIVRQSIESCGGELLVQTVEHKGTTFKIRLPQRLAIAPALILRSGKDRYALPLRRVETAVETKITPEGTAIWGGKTYRVHELDVLLGECPSPVLDSGSRILVLLTGTAVPEALALSEPPAPENVLVKPLPPPFDSLPFSAGIATLANGEFAPILDVDRMLGNSGPEPTPAARRTPEKKLVLIVDDSPSVRHMTARVVAEAGFEVATAKDGLDAMGLLTSGNRLPDVVLTDIEMPRMDGFELAAAIAARDGLRSIPIVVITSRSAEKHRVKASNAGVTAYLVKPFDEAELKKLLGELTAGKALS